MPERGEKAAVYGEAETVTSRDRTNKRPAKKREGALEDKGKSDVGEGR